MEMLMQQVLNGLTLGGIYGLVALGIAHPDIIKRNADAKESDVLILGKGLGIGIMSAALKKGDLSEEGYRQMLASTTQPRAVGTRMICNPPECPPTRCSVMPGAISSVGWITVSEGGATVVDGGGGGACGTPA